jgi:hypothetical protein
MTHILTELAHSTKETPRRILADARMSSSMKALSLLTLALSLLSNASPLSAETLESSNPFLPPGYGKIETAKKITPVVENGPISREIEFRGIVQLDGVYQFSVYNKTEQKGYWLRENQSENGISIRSFDPENQSITINMNGRSERLTLMSESGAPMPVAVSVNTSQNSQSNANTQNLPSNLQNLTQNSDSDSRRRVIPRRRVILPKK